MKHFTLLTLVISLTLLGGCTSNGDTVPTDPSAEDPETSTQARASALPSGFTFDSSVSCPELPEEEIIPKEEFRAPSLAAWAQAAETIFVGTVANVERIESPIRHSFTPWDQPTEDRGTIDADSCVNTVSYAVRIDFEDVETLHGQPVGPTLSIQLGFSHQEMDRVFFDTDDQILRDFEQNPAFMPGARVGSALVTRANGDKHWVERKFEVIDNRVYLEEFSELETSCQPALPLVNDIPDDYAGMPYPDFVAAIADAMDAELTPEQQASQASEIQSYSMFTSDTKDVRDSFKSVCNDGEIREEDPSVKNDPDAL